MTSKIELAYQFYGIYNGLNLHFKPGSKYSYSKYGSRWHLKPDKFEDSPDRFPFLGFVTSFSGKADEFEEYLKLYAVREGKLPYFRDLDDRLIMEEFKEYKRTFLYSFDYNFDILVSGLELQYFQTNGSDYSSALDDFYDRKIYPKVFVLLDRSLNLMKRYSSLFIGDLLFNSRLETYQQYESLVRFNNEHEYIKLVKNSVKTKLKKG